MHITECSLKGTMVYPPYYDASFVCERTRVITLRPRRLHCTGHFVLNEWQLSIEWTGHFKTKGMLTLGAKSWSELNSNARDEFRSQLTDGSSNKIRTIRDGCERFRSSRTSGEISNKFEWENGEGFAHPTRE